MSKHEPLREFFPNDHWQKLVRSWEREEIAEDTFVARAAVMLGDTEGSIRDMIAAFEI